MGCVGRLGCERGHVIRRGRRRDGQLLKFRSELDDALLVGGEADAQERVVAGDVLHFAENGLQFPVGLRELRGFEHHARGRLALPIHLGDQDIVGGRRRERGVRRRIQQIGRVQRAGVQIPARGDFDAIHRVLLVHRLRVIRVNVAADVVSADNLAVAHGLDRLDGWRRRGTKDKLRARSARGDEHERNEGEVFHG